MQGTPSRRLLFEDVVQALSSDSLTKFHASSKCSVSRAVRRRELGDTAEFRTQLYNSVAPNHTFEQVRDLPNALPVRFTPCGRFLVTICHNHADLALYQLEGGDLRSNWPKSFSQADSVSSDARTDLRNETDSCSFSRFFSHYYTVPVAHQGETLISDFCLASARGRFLILAAFSRGADNDGGDAAGPPAQNPNLNTNPTPLPAVRSCPVLEHFTLYLVEVETGQVYDRFIMENDFVQLEANRGIHIFQDMLCILSLRNQTLNILRIQESMGRFVHERAIGSVCNGDDEAEIARMATPQDPDASGDVECGLGNGKRRDAPFCGLMQRLLAYVYREFARRGNASKFFHVVAQYSMLLMLRAQLLHDDYVLIELGPEEDAGRIGSGGWPHFYLVYCLSKSEVVRLFQDRSLTLLHIFERYHDLFYDSPESAAAAWRPPPTEARTLRGSRSDIARRAQRALVHLPVRSVSNTPSPYLDRSLYSYDMTRVSMTSHQNTLHDFIKFTSVRTGLVRFRLGFGMAIPASNVRLILHPSLPFALSVTIGHMNLHTVLALPNR